MNSFRYFVFKVFIVNNSFFLFCFLFVLVKYHPKVLHFGVFCPLELTRRENSTVCLDPESFPAARTCSFPPVFTFRFAASDTQIREFWVRELCFPFELERFPFNSEICLLPQPDPSLPTIANLDCTPCILVSRSRGCLLLQDLTRCSMKMFYGFSRVDKLFWKEIYSTFFYR